MIMAIRIVPVVVVVAVVVVVVVAASAVVVVVVLFPIYLHPVRWKYGVSIVFMQGILRQNDKSFL